MKFAFRAPMNWRTGVKAPFNDVARLSMKTNDTFLFGTVYELLFSRDKAFCA